MEHSQRQAHHLQILAPRRRRDIPRLRPDIECDGLLQPRDQEMGTLVDDLIRDTSQAIEDDSTSATLDIVDGGAGEREGESARNGVAGDLREDVRRHSVGICVIV